VNWAYFFNDTELVWGKLPRSKRLAINLGLEILRNLRGTDD